MLLLLQKNQVYCESSSNSSEEENATSLKPGEDSQSTEVTNEGTVEPAVHTLSPSGKKEDVEDSLGPKFEPSGPPLGASTTVKSDVSQQGVIIIQYSKPQTRIIITS